MTDSGQINSARAPDLAAVQRAFSEFCLTVARLRDPQGGCPWDLQQDHMSLRRYMIEEAYEAAEAMAQNHPQHLCEELGDVLLQVVLNSQVALDAGTFSLIDVISGIDAKMRRRHPHVFAAAADAPSITTDQVRKAWEEIKREEHQAPAVGSRTFIDAVSKHPATAQAYKIGKIAAKINFDWDNSQEVLAQVRSEVDELADELNKPSHDKAKIAEELGDIYFSLAQLARHLDLDPEVVSVDANRKFLRRFEMLEDIAAERGIAVRTAARVQLEALWAAVKEKEKAKS
jgi:MazG family protein